MEVDVTLDWKQIRQWVIIIASGIILYWGLEHLEVIGGVVGNVIGMLSPFLIGASVAFILRRPLASIEGFLLKLSEYKEFAWLKKVSRILGIIFTFLLFVAVTVLQMLAYYIAIDKGLDVDKPRNLAKVVTVE